MTFEEASEMAIAFRNTRDWKQFHTPKDIALSIAIETGELLEVYQWSGADLSVEQKREHAIEELADIAIYCAYMADALGVSLPEIMSDKIDANEAKYPVEKSKGNAKKYSEFD